MMRKTMILLSSLALVAWVAGCRVNVDKDSSGQDKRVQVDTPLGGVHVNTDQTTAADLGLPVYPGAQIVKDDDDSKSADVHIGLGAWQLRVRVVSYSSPDSQDKIEAFYKKALARFGPVLTCQNNAAVGTPTQTPEGLTCADDKKHTNVDIGGGVQLKAGSKHRQHIVGFEEPKDRQTRFSLVSLDLPSMTDSSSD
ncbi:MAG: hypothetical protein WCA37_00755 [Terracidiphilus sp.]